MSIEFLTFSPSLSSWFNNCVWCSNQTVGAAAQLILMEKYVMIRLNFNFIEFECPFAINRPLYQKMNQKPRLLTTAVRCILQQSVAKRICWGILLWGIYFCNFISMLEFKFTFHKYQMRRIINWMSTLTKIILLL